VGQFVFVRLSVEPLWCLRQRHPSRVQTGRRTGFRFPSNHNPYSSPMTNITHKPGIQTIPTPVIPAQAGIHCVFPRPLMSSRGLPCRTKF